MILDDKLISKLLDDLGNSWAVNQYCRLYKEYIVKDFKCAMAIANDIAIAAENLNHHPDLKVSYGKCVIEIWSHDLNRLSNNDFILANAIESIAKTKKW